MGRRMQLGDHLGPYEIIGRLGQGGMGEVFLARDSRLPRQVAIKVLPAEVAGHARLRVGLEREAKAISSLNHPNICTLHDVGREGEIDYLVLEYCEGATLAARLDAGRLSLSDALRHGIEMADALARAHRAGVVHRDLKPSNVMLTGSGVKLLDFGLARREAIADADRSVTTSLRWTEETSFAGTLPYMAPEVLGGSEADARSDIFALGAVLYEMLAGTPAFAGATKASVIGAILEREPSPLSELRPEIPPQLEHVVARCLARNPEERWQSARDVAEELRWITRQTGTGNGELAGTRRTSRKGIAAVAMAAVVLAGAAAAFWMLAERGAVRSAPVRLSISVRPITLATGPATPDLAISPDGRQIVFAGVDAGVVRLYSRRLESLEAVPLAGTEQAKTPFFSPDGEWVAFFAQRSLKRVPASGGNVETIANAVAGNERGATWARDGTIYFAPNYSGGIRKVRLGDPRARPVTEPDETRRENSHRWPHVLPDGKHLLITIRTDRLTTFDDATIAVVDLTTGKWRSLIHGGTSPRYVATGHLVYARGDTLFAVRFDPAAAKVLSKPVAVATGVTVLPSAGSAHFAVAEESGDLVFTAGGEIPHTARFETVDRSGARTELATIPHRVNAFSVSPDGTRLALQVMSANDDIWTYDIARSALTRVSFEPGDEFWPSWTPDGSRLLFGSARGLYWQPVDGSPGGEPLGVRNAFGTSVSPDGSRLAFSVLHEETGLDLWLLTLDGKAEARPFLQTPFAETAPQFSRDGAWIAYSANESGSPEVYLRSASGEGGRFQISVDGGDDPRWSADGREIFYQDDDEFFAVPVVLASTPEIGKPRHLFTMHGVDRWEPYADGFLMQFAPGDLADRDTIHVTLGWSDELRRLVP